MELLDLLEKPKPAFYFLYCPSDLLLYFVQRSLIKELNIDKLNIVDVNSVRKLNTTTETNKLRPFLSDGWLYNIADKVNLSKDHNKLISTNRFGYYIIRVSDFKQFMKYQTLFENNAKAEFMYLSYLKRQDMDYLYNTIVQKDDNSFKLDNKIKRFLFQNYNNDIEKVLILYSELKRGVEVKSQKDIVNICGISSKTLDFFLFYLLKTPTYTKRGLANYAKRLLQDGTELAKNYSYKGLQTILINNLMFIFEIKHMFRTNQINNTRVLDLDKSYSERKVKRYRRWYDEINHIPLSRLSGLLLELKREPIYNELDFFNFVYRYILYKAKSQPLEVEKALAKEKRKEAEKKAKEEKEEKEGTQKPSVKKAKPKKNIKKEKVNMLPLKEIFEEEDKGKQFNNFKSIVDDILA